MGTEIAAWLSALANVSLSDAFATISKVIGFVGGTGGIVYWVNLWRSRVRVVAVVLNDTADARGSESEVTLSVEFENLGRQSTSLNPSVVVRGSCPNFLNAKARMIARTTYRLHIERDDRDLQPYKPKRLTAKARVADTYLFARFRVYKFRLTTGGKAVARRLWIGSRDVGAWEYWRWRIWHLLTSGLPPKDNG